MISDNSVCEHSRIRKSRVGSNRGPVHKKLHLTDAVVVGCGGVNRDAASGGEAGALLRCRNRDHRTVVGGRDDVDRAEHEAAVWKTAIRVASRGDVEGEGKRL